MSARCPSVLCGIRALLADLRRLVEMEKDFPTYLLQAVEGLWLPALQVSSEEPSLAERCLRLLALAQVLHALGLTGKRRLQLSFADSQLAS